MPVPSNPRKLPRGFELSCPIGEKVLLLGDIDAPPAGPVHEEAHEGELVLAKGEVVVVRLPVTLV